MPCCPNCKVEDHVAAAEIRPLKNRSESRAKELSRNRRSRSRRLPLRGHRSTQTALIDPGSSQPTWFGHQQPLRPVFQREPEPQPKRECRQVVPTPTTRRETGRPAATTPKGTHHQLCPSSGCGRRTTTVTAGSLRGAQPNRATTCAYSSRSSSRRGGISNDDSDLDRKMHELRQHPQLQRQQPQPLPAPPAPHRSPAAEILPSTLANFPGLLTPLIVQVQQQQQQQVIYHGQLENFARTQEHHGRRLQHVLGYVDRFKSHGVVFSVTMSWR